MSLIAGDAMTIAADSLTQHAASAALGPLRVAVTFALAAPPDALVACLPEGASLVAPVGDDDQRLMRWVREHGVLVRTTHGSVRYVARRA